jgi:hypothetical protein
MKLNTVIKQGAITLLWIALFSLSSFAQNASKTPIANLLIGTYTEKGSKGIYVYHFDTATGKATELSHTNNSSNPSFLTISKDKQNVYAVNENKEGHSTIDLQMDYCPIHNSLFNIVERASTPIDRKKPIFMVLFFLPMEITY